MLKVNVLLSLFRMFWLTEILEWMGGKASGILLSSLECWLFCWVVRHHKIFIIDKLKRRNHFLVNGCRMSFKDEEMLHHMLIHCQFPLSLDGSY